MPTHCEQRVVPYTPEQMFDLVADIDRYPEFLPWCRAARIRSRKDQVVEADLVIGFKMVRERFTSRVSLNRPECIDVEYVRGPMRYLNNHWRFLPHPNGCLIDFFVDFEFHSKMLQKLIGALFNEAFRRMASAFEVRAGALYGAEPSAPPILPPAANRPSAPSAAQGQ